MCLEGLVVGGDVGVEGCIEGVEGDMWRAYMGCMGGVSGVY